jgi:hypothetical protein
MDGVVINVKEPLLAVLVVAGSDHVLRPERSPAAELLRDALLDDDLLLLGVINDSTCGGTSAGL